MSESTYQYPDTIHTTDIQSARLAEASTQVDEIAAVPQPSYDMSPIEFVPSQEQLQASEIVRNINVEIQNLRREDFALAA